MTDQEIKTRWYEFANRAFIEWRGDTRSTLSQFAEWLGLSQSLVSQELSRNGKIPRDLRTINAWASRYGDQVYEVLGLPPPDSEEAFKSLPPEVQSAAREIRETLGKYSVAPDSPEAESIREEIMKKHGFAKISTKTP